MKFLKNLLFSFMLTFILSSKLIASSEVVKYVPEIVDGDQLFASFLETAMDCFDPMCDFFQKKEWMKAHSLLEKLLSHYTRKELNILANSVNLESEIDYSKCTLASNTYQEGAI